MVLTTLAHHVDREFLREAYRRTRKDGAVGVDGQTAADYEAHLEENLEDLLTRFKSGSYRAPPVRRVHIPKGDGSKTRPLGVPTFEDKVLQRAVCMVLEAVYEQDFLPCSYGFRPGRSAHQALQALWNGLMEFGGGWVVDADIQGFFDALDHGVLRGFLDQRVRDGVLRRSVDKWLKAGVLEDGVVRTPDSGTPQGGVISPLLANVYLHHVLDTWYENEIRPRLRGRSQLVRYADDFVIVCEREEDARRVMTVLPKRLGKHGLTLHPEKTKIVRFTRPPRGRLAYAADRPETFDLLGFTHHWGLSRRHNWVVKRRTSRKRFTRALKAISAWCSKHRHLSVKEQHAALARKLRGHDAYYGITGNGRQLAKLRRWVERIWRKWLGRRSNRANMVWEAYGHVLRRYPLPGPVVVHSVYRQQRTRGPRSRMRQLRMSGSVGAPGGKPPGATRQHPDLVSDP
jgi:group II intron reverse transcriptase/maturase